MLYKIIGDDVMVHILNYLDVSDLLNIYEVNKSLNILCHKSAGYKLLLIYKYFSKFKLISDNNLNYKHVKNLMYDEKNEDLVKEEMCNLIYCNKHNIVNQIYIDMFYQYRINNNMFMPSILKKKIYDIINPNNLPTNRVIYKHRKTVNDSLCIRLDNHKRINDIHGIIIHNDNISDNFVISIFINGTHVIVYNSIYVKSLKNNTIIMFLPIPKNTTQYITLNICNYDGVIDILTNYNEFTYFKRFSDINTNNTIPYSYMNYKDYSLSLVKYIIIKSDNKINEVKLPIYNKKNIIIHHISINNNNNVLDYIWNYYGLKKERYSNYCVIPIARLPKYYKNIYYKDVYINNIRYDLSIENSYIYASGILTLVDNHINW